MSAFACICGVICHLLIYFTKKFWLIIFGFILYGLGIGMGYYPILKTTWKYFPNNKGFLTGFILSVFGLCPMVFTSIADAVMNPDGESMIGEYYPDEIANKMKDFSLIMAITMGFCGILSQVLMFPMDNVEEETQVNENTNLSQQESSSYVSNETYDKKKISDENINEPFNEAVKSWRFHMFNFMSVGTLCKYIYIYIYLYIYFFF